MFPVQGPEGTVVAVRDAWSLNIFKVVNTTAPWDLAVCGEEGCEIVISTSRFKLEVTRGSRSQILIEKIQRVKPS